MACVLAYFLPFTWPFRAIEIMLLIRFGCQNRLFGTCASARWLLDSGIMSLVGFLRCHDKISQHMPLKILHCQRQATGKVTWMYCAPCLAPRGSGAATEDVACWMFHLLPDYSFLRAGPCDTGMNTWFIPEHHRSCYSEKDIQIVEAVAPMSMGRRL